ncbi:MAG: hypothetical protein JNJ76_01540 [Candidatus Competibacter sp.]|nr:hypothetical protein [Candidatus Competibacter sp.]
MGDGATDATDRIAWEEGARVVGHPYSLVNNGATVKTGACHATGEVLVLMGAGSQHHSTSLDPVGVSVPEAVKITC